MSAAHASVRPSLPPPARALRRLLGEAAASCMPAGVSPFPLLRVAADATLVHEGAPLRNFYLVEDGHFKTVRNCEDGYEQVLDFVGTDALLGCDGLADGRYASGAVALCEGWVYALPATAIQHMCQQEPAFAARWQASMARQIACAGDRTWVMSAVGAEKRLARFLVMALRRQAGAGPSSLQLHLPMCRRDLGSHLGLSHESVSRAFTLLDSAGLLRVHNRAIEFDDPEALGAFASSTRGYAALRRDLAIARTAAACRHEAAQPWH